MPDRPFEVVSSYTPGGDQPTAIDGLVDGLNAGFRFQTLLGATGTGKTFSIANVIQRVQRPTLVIAHNKTLAAQLCGEFRDFFLIMRSNILLVITTTFSLKLTSRKLTHISKKICQSMKR